MILPFFAKDRLERLLIVLIIFSCLLFLFSTAPTAGNFWWSDAPRHALNGAFIKDLIQAAPWGHPKIWAINYYLKYPSLTILFYPPLFYFFEAVAYALFGVSNLVAQATVDGFTLLLAAATYGIARLAFPRWSAVGASLLVIGAPETALWERQVMLDVPAYSALVTSVYFFLRYLRNNNIDIYISIVFMISAIYIKYNCVFMIPTFAIIIFMVKGSRAFLDKHIVAVGLVTLFCLIPAGWLTVEFGRANVQSVMGRPHDLSLASVAAWTFYLKAMRQYLGYPLCLLAALGIVLSIIRQPAPTGYAALMGGWIVCGYFFISAIGVREPRHGMMLTFPLVMFAIIAIHRILPRSLAPLATMGLGIATFIYSLVFCPVPRIDGYQAVANYVASHAEKNAVVAFSGYRDGNFVFDLRTHEERRDISTLRVDKLLLGVSVERDRGIVQENLNEGQILAMLRNLGVGLVVVQPGFWNDLTEMRLFSHVINGSNFSKIAHFPITGSLGRYDSNSVDIYKPTYLVEKTTSSLTINMPIIGSAFRANPGTP